ncbi:2-dehydro-3-deoxygluconokinase [subsurface metagenome]|nr:sugar kinase [Clostridia bacterium]
MKKDKKLHIKPKSECMWDGLALGEIMIRLDPGNTRIKTARNFKIWEGGGEYNVIRGLKKCFSLDTAVVTGIVENDIGYLLQDLINQGGIDMRYVKWFGFDGIGREARVGLNFTERGFGIRRALGVSDRANSAASKLKVGDIDFNKIFKVDGVRWFHTGGIFAALSETTPEAIIEAAKAAKEAGTVVSYDLNYRASLWKAVGGSKKAIEVNREIAKYVDVMIGNEEDFTKSLGFEVEGIDKGLSKLDPENFKRMINCCLSQYPNFKAVATTLRAVKTATINDWSAVLYYGGNFYTARKWENLEIYDRVGGGDSFASGLIYGFLSDKSPKEIVEYGAAHGALAMTTPGDTSMASLKEVEKIVTGGSARVER